MSARSVVWVALLAACQGPRPPTADPLLSLNAGRDYVYCRAELAKHRVDVDAENARAFAEAARVAGHHDMPFDAIIVPGYTPLDQAVPLAKPHAVAKLRLMRAAEDYERGVAPFVVVSGGNAHPTGTPFNEALTMKQFLVDGGFPEQRVFIEPCALHSHTNLRNTARLLLSARLPRGLVVTSYDQAYYFAHATATGLRLRQRSQFGTGVGALYGWDDYHVVFVPRTSNFRMGKDKADP